MFFFDKIKKMSDEAVNEKSVYKFPIRLDTKEQVVEFNEIVKGIDKDVMLVGSDEFGQPWSMNAKSFLNSIVLVAMAKENKEREHNAHEVDYNTLYVLCEDDISSLLNKYVPLAR